jgi:hypothetical protein
MVASGGWRIRDSFMTESKSPQSRARQLQSQNQKTKHCICPSDRIHGSQIDHHNPKVVLHPRRHDEGLTHNSHATGSLRGEIALAKCCVSMLRGEIERTCALLSQITEMGSQSDLLRTSICYRQRGW